MLRTFPRIRLCWCGEGGSEEWVDAAEVEEPIIREGALPQEMKVGREGERPARVAEGSQAAWLTAWRWCRWCLRAWS